MIKMDQESKDWIEKKIFNASPNFIAAIDKDLNIVYANQAYENRFGPWQGKKCFDVYKKTNAICEDCTSRFAFSNGKTSVSEQTGVDKDNRLIHYIKYTVPVMDKNQKIKYLAEISTETTRFKKTEKEYKLLFEQVPCNVIIIDRNFKIVRANKRADEMFHDLQGQYCFSALKCKQEKCADCTARKTFDDGAQHTGYHSWNLPNGKKVHLHVVTNLLKGEDPQQDLVMEMAVDISKTIKLQDRLKTAHHYLESLINTSMDGIVGISERGKVEVFNKAARQLFDIDQGQIVSLEDINTMLPKGFLARVSEGKSHVYLPEAKLKKSDGEIFFGRLIGNRLKDSEKNLGMAFSVHDISQFKQLEEEKIEAERMAIVGQTVAGLAHGIKNLINALDGGMYFLKSGIGKGDIKRVHKGIETLSRNINRIRDFSMAFLNYARFRAICAEECNPSDIAREVAESFELMAKEKNIQISVIQKQKIAPIFLDYEKIHECITNLVGNAIDSYSTIEDDREKAIIISIYEEEGSIYVSIADNGCGIDDEHRKRLFHKFFTTKGLEGTGLGLLMTQKIIQEHGGNISVFSQKDEGSVFRIRFLRGRLPKSTG
ncbi:MAG: ATP-binding protein [Pseudomonadota bacterium]